MHWETKVLCDSLCRDICSIVAVWNRTHGISEVWLQLLLRRQDLSCLGRKNVHLQRAFLKSSAWRLSLKNRHFGGARESWGGHQGPGSRGCSGEGGGQCQSPVSPTTTTAVQMEPLDTQCEANHCCVLGLSRGPRKKTGWKSDGGESLTVTAKSTFFCFFFSFFFFSFYSHTCCLSKFPGQKLTQHSESTILLITIKRNRSSCRGSAVNEPDQHP